MNVILMHAGKTVGLSPRAARARACSACVLTMVFIGSGLMGCSGGASRPDAQVDDAPAFRPPVVPTAIMLRDLEERLTVQGNVESKDSAQVHPRIPGVLDKIYVDLGDEVEANKTPLFQSDSLKVAKAVEISRQDLAVARLGAREADANLERVQAGFDKAEIDYHRFKRLYEQNAVTLDVFERQESRYKQTAAGLKHAKTMVEHAAERVRQAELALQIAEKNLSDSLVYAPISGRISHRFREPGEMGDTGRPVLRIAGLDPLEVSAFLPAAHYPAVIPGQSKARIRVSGIDLGMQTITYKSPTIEPTLRSFQIKCLIEGPPEGVAPGAMAQVEVVLQQRRALSAPTASILTRGDRQVVFLLDGDVARMVPVETGLSSDGWTEVNGDGIAEGALVVRMGQHQLNDGMRVTVQQEAS